MRNSKFLLATAFLFFFSTRAHAQLQRNDSERQLFEALNRERTAQGLSALQWDNALFKAARQHALGMANLNRLEHQLPSESNLEGRLAEAGARKTCETDAGFAGTSAKSMIRFEATDLERLPEVLERKIRSAPYSKAAVGACRANGTSGFARYRIAVLFF